MVYRAAWAQRRGQDHAGQLHHGACAGGERQHDLAARGSAAAKSAAATDGAPRRTRHQPRPARAATLLAAERGGESAGGADGRARRPRRIPPLIYSLFPNLRQMRTRRAGDLCEGAQRQLAIGRALAQEPALLILDEPTTGVPPSIAADIGNVIRRLNYELGMTILLVEHQLPFVRRVADRFCLLDSGRTVAHGALTQLDEALIGAGLAGQEEG